MSVNASQDIPGLKQKKVFKIIVLGDSGVGKTCLTYRFCEGQFLNKSEATIGVDFRERIIKIRNEDIKSISAWMQEIESHGLMNAPRVLVGNKCDCGTPESRLATTYAQRLADKYGMPLFETSALLDSECDNVESIFLTLAHKLYSKQPLRVISVAGEVSKGVVTLSRQRKVGCSSDQNSCLCN
uniref:Uncharacterized protein n=1 Tax=Bombyx mori TaxID=7091 RepID=A0A8R2M1H6_BOMMO|nr:putative Ras-related protein Rab-33 isoform X2 [Bombyx mori]